METRPLVTVGIPTYNNPEGLLKTIGSILNQEYQNLQVIISDNNSTSYDVYELLKDIIKNDRRVKVFRQTTNIDMIPNFRFVMEQCEGEYFMWAADDDFFELDFISECLKVFSANPDCVSVFSHFDVVDTNSGKVYDRITPTPASSDFLFVRLKLRIKEMIPNVVYGVHKYAVLKKTDRIAAFDWFDVLLSIQMVYYGKAYIIPHFLYHCGINGPRKPYSLTGKYLDFSTFKKRLREFMQDKLPLRQRLQLIGIAGFACLQADRRLKKVIDNWHK